MKKFNYGFIFVLFISIFFVNNSKSQSITETEVFKNTTGVDLQAYGVVFDKSGNWAFLQSDNSNSQISRSKIISNKFTSDWMENLNDVGKFDGHGNLYSATYTLKTDGSNDIDYYTLLVNGAPAGNYEYLDPYDAIANKDGDYEFVYSKAGDYYIGKMSYGTLVPSASYKMIKYAFKSYAGSSDTRGEGDGVKGDIADEDVPTDQLFRDADGNIGYVLLTDNNASIKFGEKIIETNFKDINESSFQLDNNKDMLYIGKDRSDYSYNGFQTVAMKNSKYMVKGIINTPIVFMSDNTPVYSVTDSLNDLTYLSKVYKGDKELPLYRDAAKTKKFIGFNSGITDLTVDKGRIVFTGSNYTTGKKSELYPDGEQVTKGSYVVDGVMGPELENISMIKKSASGKLLYSYMPDHSKIKYSLFSGSMSSPEKVIDKDYSYFTEYGFIGNTDNYYAIANTDENFEKKIPAKSYIYMNGRLVGENELTISTNSLIADDFSTVRFAPDGNYAFAGGKSSGDTWIYNVYTKHGVEKAKNSEFTGLTDFNSIDYIWFTPASKLFYIGGVNNSQGLNYAMKNYVVYDGKVLDKYYDSVQDFKYNSSDNSVSFKGIRDNTLYNVKVSL